MESIAPPSPRVTRGIALHRDHGDRIIHEGHGVYLVPGCSGGTYTVDLAIGGDVETCSCPDFDRHHAPCKHVYAATIYRARTRAAARKVQAERTAARASRASLTPLAGVGV